MPHYRIVLAPVARRNIEKPRSALALINLKFVGSDLLDSRPNVEIRTPFSKGENFLIKECGREPSSELTPEASAASFGHIGM